MKWLLVFVCSYSCCADAPIIKTTKYFHDPYGKYIIRKNGRPMVVKGPCTKKVITYSK